MSATVVDDRSTLYVIPIVDGIKRYLIHCRDVSGISASTIKAREAALDRLAEACTPGMALHMINSQHIGFALRAARQGETPRQTALRRARNPQVKPRKPRAEGTLNLDRGIYRSFIQWAKNNRYYSHYDNPCVDLRDVKSSTLRSKRDETRYYVPINLRAALLEEAGNRHPRDRFVCAMGLYGGRRADDMLSMNIGDIDLDAETFRFTNGKSGGRRVVLPYSLWPEFGQEIRGWLAWLAGQIWPLNPDWPLIPARLEQNEYRGLKGRAQMHPGWPIDPTRRTTYVSLKRDVQWALEGIGATSEGITAGVHSLRHSCSRWLRTLQDPEWSEDDISDWLDHANASTTRSIYLSGTDVANRLVKKYA